MMNVDGEIFFRKFVRRGKTESGTNDLKRLGNNITSRVLVRITYTKGQILREDFIASQKQWLESQDRSAPPILDYPGDDDMEEIGAEANQQQRWNPDPLRLRLELNTCR